MGNGKVDHILPIHGIHHAILAEVTNNLHFYHNGRFLQFKTKRQVSIIIGPVSAGREQGTRA
jgi:hypothetical protein